MKIIPILFGHGLNNQSIGRLEIHGEILETLGNNFIFQPSFVVHPDRYELVEVSVVPFENHPFVNHTFINHTEKESPKQLLPEPKLKLPKITNPLERMEVK